MLLAAFALNYDHIAMAQPAPHSQVATNSPMNNIEKVMADHADALMKLNDVVGVAESLCNGQPCIKVLLSRDNPATRAEIPTELDGIPVAVEVSGPITAQPR
jgi:hypothetical protein